MGASPKYVAIRQACRRDMLNNNHTIWGIADISELTGFTEDQVIAVLCQDPNKQYVIMINYDMGIVSWEGS